jgi:hypothetical protein
MGDPVVEGTLRALPGWAGGDVSADEGEGA